ncbi:hypothetical protein AgCh_022950 [Apium graveolens]
MMNKALIELRSEKLELDAKALQASLEEIEEDEEEAVSRTRILRLKKAMFGKKTISDELGVLEDIEAYRPPRGGIIIVQVTFPTFDQFYELLKGKFIRHYSHLCRREKDTEGLIHRRQRTSKSLGDYLDRLKKEVGVRTFKGRWRFERDRRSTKEITTNDIQAATNTLEGPTKTEGIIIGSEGNTEETKSLPSIPEPFVADPTINIHGEPIIPKEEPIDWDTINLPTFLTTLPLPKKQKRKSKSTPPLNSKKFTQKHKPNPKPPISKDDYVHICDIKEISDIELYLDELEDVRGIAAYRQLPERLVFRYKGAGERTWPLYRILNEGYSTLIRVFSAIQKDSGFTRTAKTKILNKIANIRKTWREPNALPRTLLIQERGTTIHKSPHWLIEFRDDKGVRRFFRLEDQLKIASNETLKEMQSKLEISDKDEAEFFRQLQLQIEENDKGLGKKTRDHRRKR